MRIPPRAWYLTVAVVFGLAGCAGARPAAAPPTAAVVDLATRSGAWPATQQKLETAVNRLTDQCLAEHGFNRPPIVPATPPSPEDETTLIDLPGRRRHGYRLDSNPAGETVQQSPNDQYYTRLSPHDQERFRTAVQTWRSCMAARGYHHDTPEAAENALRARHDKGPATVELRQEEIATAVADGECATSAHLPSTALAARRGLVASLPTAERDVLTALTERRKEALRWAAVVLT